MVGSFFIINILKYINIINILYKSSYI
ncbi:hypothetical protein Zm00014a_033001 [Zea mays]|uniref:Uncharacterized protein n=1 Tax=Zea mays TaxID=4577 RepID=A0A317Y6D1_MAIZE|nr:hypothetical protein Zm00014a_033001 [Zea mays]